MINPKWVIIAILIVLVILEIVAATIIYQQESKLQDKNIVEILTNIQNNTVLNMQTNLGYITFTLLRAATINNIYELNVTNDVYQQLIHYDDYPLQGYLPAFLWIPYLNVSQIDGYREFIRNTSDPEYDIYQINIVDNMTVPDKPFIPITDFSQREYYAPLTYVAEKIPINISVLGYDMLSNPLTASFINSILYNNGTTTISNRVFYNSSTGAAVTISQASCKTELPCHQEDIIGFHMLLVSTKQFILQSIPQFGLNFQEDDIKIAVYNVFKNETVEILLMDLNLDMTKNPYNTTMCQYQYLKNVTMVNRKWTILLCFSELYVESVKTINLVTILITTILSFTILDIILLFVSIGYFVLRSRTNAVNLKYLIANNMLGYVNHEIRNPLNSIIGLVDISRLQIDELSIPESDNNTMESIKSNLDTATQSGLLLRHIVNDILDVRKLEEGKLELTWTKFWLSEFIKSLTKIIQPKLLEKPNLVFTTTYVDCEINTDYIRLTQLLLNFMTNAIKYTHAGSIELKIEDWSEERIKFSMIDTGIGIPDESKNRIFKPFEQVQDDNPRYGGIGLGLFLCNLLINNLQGEIGFESQKGVGSTFWFIINKWEKVRKGSGS